jgi:hypothetical protein
MLGQDKAAPNPIAEHPLPFGCSLEILTAVLLFNVFGEISSYFVMTCPPIYCLAIKAFTADWTVASKSVPAHNVIANNLDFWHTHQLATT